MTKQPFPSDQQDKFMLRLPDGLRDRIKAKADDNGRSMNAEIVQLLEREYPAPKASPLQMFAQSMAHTLDRLGVRPPEGMTLDDLARIAYTDYLVGDDPEKTLSDLGAKLRSEAQARQAAQDSLDPYGHD